MTKVLVTGAAGFIGGHLCRYLKEQGYFVRAVDYVPPRYGLVSCHEANWYCDLRDLDQAHQVFRDIDQVYALAADMGGLGYIAGDNPHIMTNNMLININTFRAALVFRASVLFTSSACVYPPCFSRRKLKEVDAHPAAPGTSYGWEKLFAELLGEDYNVCVARQTSVYGPRCAWQGGREKVVGALCRKVAEAKRDGRDSIEIWGSGWATRSFCHADDLVRLLHQLMEVYPPDPVNIGDDRLVTIAELAFMIAEIAGVELRLESVPGPTGTLHRDIDLSRQRELLDYEPQVSLEDGLARTYEWIETQILTT